MKRRTLLTAGAGSMLLASRSGISAANAARAVDDDSRRQELYRLLGRLPPRDRKVGTQLVSTEDRGSYVLEKLILDLNGEEPAPAWFARPKGASGRRPTVLF